MRGRPFQPGNKFGRGRPRGSRNKATRLSQATLDSHAETLMKKCLCLAYDGNPTAMRICMDRLLPARRQRAVYFKLPSIKTIADVAAASELVTNGVAQGKMTPAEGKALSDMLDGRRRIIETQELEQRIRILEDLHKQSTEQQGNSGGKAA